MSIDVPEIILPVFSSQWAVIQEQAAENNDVNFHAIAFKSYIESAKYTIRFWDTL